MLKYVVGIDVGGTNTDAVVLQNEVVVARCKTRTTDDITTGIFKALKHLLETNQGLENQISSINIGTTLLVNSSLESRGLDKPVVVRLGYPVSDAIPPTSGWDEQTRAKVGKCYKIKGGGYQYNLELIGPLEVERIREIARETKDKTKSVAITGIFSPINPDQELLVGEIFKEINSSVGISLSHQLGDVGLLGRENAAIVNALFFSQFENVRRSIKDSVQLLGIKTNIYLTQGNGVKKRIDNISSNPLLILKSGPINSIKGAALLANVQDAITVDIGGTSTDVGIIKLGQPVNENCQTEVAGIRYTSTSARIETSPLGGGTIVDVNIDGTIRLGPESLGSKLFVEGLVFGGEILTPTDIAIYKRRFEIPEAKPELIKQALFKIDRYKNAISRFFGIAIEEITDTHIERFIQSVDDAIHEKLLESINVLIDSMEEIPENLVLVGGGVKLFDLESPKLQDLKRKFRHILIPEDAGVANALGAAISLLGSTVKKYYPIGVEAEQMAFEQAKALLIKQGADPRTIVKTSVHSLPLSYLQDSQILVSLSAVGKDSGECVADSDVNDIYDVLKRQDSIQVQEKKTDEIEELQGERKTIEPTKLLTREAINDMALGAGWLGSGGGSDPEKGRLATLKVMKKKEVRLVSLDNLRDDALVVSFGAMGSPNIGSERLYTREEGIRAIRIIERELQRKVDAILTTEGAGANGLYPLSLAAQLDIPVVDADCKGRALPLLNMITPNIFGKFDNILAVLSNGLREEVIHAKSFDELESVGRELTTKMGGNVSKAQLPLSGKQLKELTIKGTLSTVQQIGASIRLSQGSRFNIRLKALNEVLAKTSYKEAVIVCEGKIEAFSPTKEGAMRLGGFIVKNSNQTELFGIGFQNENLFVRRSSDKQNIALVPEIINVVDANTFQIISCERLKYGQEVAIVVMSPPEMLTRPEAKQVIRKEDTLEALYKLVDSLFLKV